VAWLGGMPPRIVCGGGRIPTAEPSEEFKKRDHKGTPDDQQVGALDKAIAGHVDKVKGRAPDVTRLGDAGRRIQEFMDESRILQTRKQTTGAIRGSRNTLSKYIADKRHRRTKATFSRNSASNKELKWIGRIIPRRDGGRWQPAAPAIRA